MNTLSVWRYDAADLAETALRDLERHQDRRRVTIDDSAVVSWEHGARRPRAYQSGIADGTAGLSGAFWGLLFSLAFLLPPNGAGQELVGVGLSHAFLRRLRERIVPGTSALFVLTDGGVPEDLRRALAAADVELLVQPLDPEQVAALRRSFAEDEHDRE